MFFNPFSFLTIYYWIIYFQLSVIKTLNCDGFFELCNKEGTQVVPHCSYGTCTALDRLHEALFSNCATFEGCVFLFFFCVLPFWARGDTTTDLQCSSAIFIFSLLLVSSLFFSTVHMTRDTEMPNNFPTTLSY